MVRIRHRSDVLGVQGAALQALVFGLLEDEVFDGAGVFDVSELQLGMGDVADPCDKGGTGTRAGRHCDFRRRKSGVLARDRKRKR